MDTFNSSPSWRRYREILAADFGLHLTEQPAEIRRHLLGHDIRLDTWTPEGAPRGTLILVHGGGGHGRILAPFAEPAAALGWRVIAPDLPGFGLTRPARGWRGDYADWPRVIAALAAGEPGPVVLLGASMGGMTAVHAAMQARGVAGVIATTLLDLTDPSVFAGVARWRWLGRLSLLSARLAPALLDRLVLPLRLAAPLRAMSSSPALQRYFSTDRELGRRPVSARFWRTAHAYRPGPLRLACPLLLVHPGADTWTPTALSRRTLETIEAQEKRFVELPDGAHLPVEQPALDALMAEVAAFLKGVCASQAEGAAL